MYPMYDLRPTSCRPAVPAIALMICAMTLAIPGCATQESDTKTNASDKSAMMKTFGQYKYAWSRRDPAGVVNAMHPSGTFTSPAAGKKLSPEAFAGYMQVLFGAVPDFQAEVKQVGTLDENTLAEEWVVKGTWTQPFAAGPLAGLAPTGKSFVLPGSTIIGFKDGKMASQVQYFDNMSLVTQIGAVPTK